MALEAEYRDSASTHLSPQRRAFHGQIGAAHPGLRMSPGSEVERHRIVFRPADTNTGQGVFLAPDIRQEAISVGHGTAHDLGSAQAAFAALAAVRHGNSHRQRCIEFCLSNSTGLRHQHDRTVIKSTPSGQHCSSKNPSNASDSFRQVCMREDPVGNRGLAPYLQPASAKHEPMVWCRPRLALLR